MTANYYPTMMKQPHVQKKKKVSKPTPCVAAGAGGGIIAPSDADVLSGRGGAVNSHIGNIRYRQLVNVMKTEYLSPSTGKNQKTCIAARIVWMVRNSNDGSQPPGRFLKQDPESKLWYEIGDKAAFRKVGQALRENSAEFIKSWDGWSALGHGSVVDAPKKQTCTTATTVTTTHPNPLRSSLNGLDALTAAAVPL